MARTRKEKAAAFMYDAIKHALDDMRFHSVCPVAKRYLQAAIEYADTGKEPQYNSRFGRWTFPSEELP
ncbi:MAG TPA: hypothetical protein VI542_34960 [Candidatus Tectomicrobia bacterium]